MSHRWFGKVKELRLFRVEDKVMLRLKNLALYAFTLLPAACRPHIRRAPLMQWLIALPVERVHVILLAVDWRHRLE
jgi:hypothetical protein